MVSLLPELKLEIYSLKRQDKGFAALAGTVKDIFFKHDDTQVGGRGKAELFKTSCPGLVQTSLLQKSCVLHEDALCWE